MPTLSMPDTAIIIPARYASTRYPGKPLELIRAADGTAKPLIAHTIDAARQSGREASIHVATDDERIAKAAIALNTEVLMTPETCRNGTERIAACTQMLPQTELFVNVQGDALLTPPHFIAALIDFMHADISIGVATVAIRCSALSYRHLAEDAQEGRVGGTTVVLDDRSRALYFSKRILPYRPEGQMPGADMPVLLHLGLYAYRRPALTTYAATNETAIERIEGLEQLRFLHHGVPVSVLVMDEPGYPLVEVNNPSDVPLVEGILKARSTR